MQATFINDVRLRLAALLAIALASIVVTAQDKVVRRGVRSSKASSGATLALKQLAEDPSSYSMVISDGEEAVVSETFTLERLKRVKAIMIEARAFALTGEGSSKEEATTTRFSDPDEEAFFVDVEKFGTESSLYITLQTENGRMTIEAGTSSRIDKKEAGPFFDVLSRMESALGKKRSGSPPG